MKVNLKEVYERVWCQRQNAGMPSETYEQFLERHCHEGADRLIELYTEVAEFLDASLNYSLFRSELKLSDEEISALVNKKRRNLQHSLENYGWEFKQDEDGFYSISNQFDALQIVHGNRRKTIASQRTSTAGSDVLGATEERTSEDSGASLDSL